jgi:hypothetical protein
MTDAARSVSTTAIKTAAKGGEPEILDGIGIDWKSGRPHILCPYGTHADTNPSWRWDERKARAFCTCIEKSHSIFDVVMGKEAIGFEAAKVRAAQLLGREDLIRKRDNFTGYQATDARSLLNAPADNRDDELPFRYLAARLGIDPAEVPRPETPVAGIRSLSYFDPSSNPRRKPKEIGTWPCAIFGTLAADGRYHAHRIYLSEDGTGKAELGHRSDGHPRNPKKSAKTIAGQPSVAGRSVFWGDPGLVPHIVLAEGIETACAIAYALRSEIEAGTVAVAAAISAGGMEAFQLWPPTRNITVAADRDEGTKADGREGSRRGERAARKFGLLNHDRVAINIALPGAPGESADYLHVLGCDGVVAVRAGILGAPVFMPTPAEIVERRQTVERATEEDRVNETYPLPLLETMRIAYRRTASGRVWMHKFGGLDKDRVELWLPVSSPFGVVARLRYADQDEAYGLRVTVQGMDGHPRAIDFERQMLPRLGAAEIRSQLFAAGLRTEGAGDGEVVSILKAAEPAREIIVVSKTGWHRLPGLSDPIFVCPSGEIIGAPEGADLQLSTMTILDAPAVSGTLEGWKEATAAALGTPNCPHWALGTISGFAGPVLDLTQLDSVGINISGTSSGGKTTSQKLAVSVWSPPFVGAGLLQSMRSTENGLEAVAQASSGTVLALDEMAHADGRTVGRVIYSLAGGIGKTRMNDKAYLRRRYSWTTFFILSGECSLEEKVRGDGGVWQAGMTVRFPDVDTNELNRTVPPETFSAIDGILEHHGHAGPTFVRALVEGGLHRNPDALRREVLTAARNLASAKLDSAEAADGDKVDGAQNRAAIPFGALYIAGTIAKTAGLIPAETNVEATIKWAWNRYLGSSDAIILTPEDAAIVSLRQWIAERWDTTIRDVNIVGGNREAVGWYDTVCIYLPTSRIREAAGGNLKERHAAKILAEKQLLAKRSVKGLGVRYVPKIGKVYVYALKRSEFGWSNEAKNENYLKREDGTIVEVAGAKMLDEDVDPAKAARAA